MKMTNPKDSGEALEKRKNLSYTQGYLADVAGLSVSFISDLERGKVTAKLGNALILTD